MNRTQDIRKIKLGIVGVGSRGTGLLQELLAMEDVEIAAVSDLYEDRMREAAALIEETGRSAPGLYLRYQDLLNESDAEGVIIASSWTSHAEIAVAAMKAGKYAGMEAGGASSLEECWQLVRTFEETGTPCMLLENCCYGREEMALLNMAKQGLFGELIHCQGGYEHDLRDEVASGEEKRHYRLRNYLRRNGEIYPTHGIGPIAKYLDIHRGNRFMTLSSMSSKARGINLWARENLGPDHPAAKADFAQGDVVTTMIRCARGETILLTQDTTLPRPYSRAGRVQGTRGIWMEDNGSIHIEGRSRPHEWEAFGKYMEEYDHPLWQWYRQEGVRGGHGGMDYLCLRAFIESVASRGPTPIDVYDTAAWMAVTCLSEQSVALGGNAVSFPDFTNGGWIGGSSGTSSDYDGKYSLEIHSNA